MVSTYAPARARQGARQSSTQARLDAIGEEAREMNTVRRRRYVAARCAGYTPDAALTFANTLDAQTSPDVTATHGDQLVGAGRDVLGVQLSLVKGGARPVLTAAAPDFADDLVDELAPVVTVPGQLVLPFGGEA